eukprot:GHVS01047925.1.p1 GENE.GHVS01047925.1~~GHVS01047925.1.p1  ORF type:complete len:109 (+),score=26.79 GHVS01047925.1:46-372(+)
MSGSESLDFFRLLSLSPDLQPSFLKRFSLAPMVGLWSPFRLLRRARSLDILRSLQPPLPPVVLLSVVLLVLVSHLVPFVLSPPITPSPQASFVSSADSLFPPPSPPPP